MQMNGVRASQKVAMSMYSVNMVLIVLRVLSHANSCSRENNVVRRWRGDLTFGVSFILLYTITEKNNNNGQSEFVLLSVHRVAFWPCTLQLLKRLRNYRFRCTFEEQHHLATYK